MGSGRQGWGHPCNFGKLNTKSHPQITDHPQPFKRSLLIVTQENHPFFKKRNMYFN